MCPPQICYTKPPWVIFEWVLKQAGPHTLAPFIPPHRWPSLSPDNQCSHDQKNMGKNADVYYWYLGVCCVLNRWRNRPRVMPHLLSVSFPWPPADLFWSHKKQGQIVHHRECGRERPRPDARLPEGRARWNCNQTKFRIGCHCIRPTIKTKKIIECLN